MTRMEVSAATSAVAGRIAVPRIGRGGHHDLRAQSPSRPIVRTKMAATA